MPRARVVPLSSPPTSYTAAVERYLTGAGIAKSPIVPVATIDDPALPEVLAELAGQRGRTR